MSDESINNLNELLRSYLGPNKKVKHVEIQRLTPPGENFGSIMLKVDLDVQKNDGTEEKIYAVAKKIPALEMFRKIFHIQVTFKNEMAFYTTILPTLRDFQRECGVDDVLDCFANFYGGRISLDKNSTVVDDDAVLMLENLAASGYANQDRFEQFNLTQAKVVIKDIATFHGVTIALKLKKPDVFEKNIKPYCQVFEISKDFAKTGGEAVKRMLKEREDLVSIIPKISNWGEVPVPPPREPFAAVIHYDLWINNTMQKLENGTQMKNKLIDFQAYAYRSPAADLFFLIWTSIKTETIKNHLDEILQYYYENLIHTLKVHHCDTKDFGYDKFLEEMKLEAAVEFGHALQFSLFVVQGVKGADIKEVPTVDYLYKNTTQKAKEKLYLMVRECDRRGWL